MTINASQATAILLILLLNNPLTYFEVDVIPNAAAQRTTAAPASAQPALSSAIQLTNTTTNNRFLLFEIDPTSTYSESASGPAMVWASDWSKWANQNSSRMSYSSLDATSGKIEVFNVTLPAGEMFGYDNVIRSGKNSRGTALIGVRKELMMPGSSYYLMVDANQKSITNVPYAPAQKKASIEAISNWGNYLVALTRHVQGYPATLIPEISLFAGNSWQQVTPDDWSIITYSCANARYQMLFDATVPKQVLARGQGQYVWIKQNNKIDTTSDAGCSRPVVKGVSTDIVFDSGKVIESFAAGSEAYMGAPCSLSGESSCRIRLVAAWGKLVVYSVFYVNRTTGKENYRIWLYDDSTGSKTFMTSSSLDLANVLDVHSDGKRLIWRDEQHNVFLYDPSFGVKSLPQTEGTRGSLKLSNGWVSWDTRSRGNLTSYVYFYSISQDRLYTMKKSHLNGTLDMTNKPGVSGSPSLEMGDEIAAWLVKDLVPNQKNSTGIFLYTVNLKQLDETPGNISSVTHRIQLDWTYAYELEMSQGWILATATPKNSNYSQVFAFQPLSGSVGVTVNGEFLPLKEVRVDILQYNGEVAKNITTTYTDSAGVFSALLPQPLSLANPPYTFRVNLTQKDGRFTIMDYSGNPGQIPPFGSNATVIFQTDHLSSIKVNDNFVKIDASKLLLRTILSTTSTIPALSAVLRTTASNTVYVDDDAYIYYRTHQAYELARDVLGADGIFNRMLQVRVFSVDNMTKFSARGNQPAVNIPPEDSVIGGPNEPMNTVWHEFGHAVMWYSPIGGSNNLPRITGYNHAGYRNPSSIDAWVEGWAEYYSTLVAHYIDKRPDSQLYVWAGGVTNLNSNHKVWPWPEEFSVASALRDISTSWSGNYSWSPGAVQTLHADGANIPITQLWVTVTSRNIQNTYQLWQTFKAIPGVNQTFIDRDIFNDTNSNARWDIGEPIGKTSWTVIKSATGILDRTTDPVAIADARLHSRLWISNTGRANREGTPVVPGTAVLLNLIDVETGSHIQGITAKVVVSDPENPFSYSFTLQPGAKTFNLYLPGGSNDTATVTVGAQGYKTTRTFTVTSNDLHNNIFANLYQNLSKPYIAQVNASLTRDYTALKDYVLTAVADNTQYEVHIVTNGTIDNQSFDSQSSAFKFQAYAPVAQTGYINVTIPLLLNNGAFIVTVNNINYSSAQVTSSQTATSNQIIFTVPSGQNVVSIKLMPSTAGQASRPPTLQTTTTSTSTTISKTAAANDKSSTSSTSTTAAVTSSTRQTTPEGTTTTVSTTGASSGEAANYPLIIGVAAVILLVAGLAVVALRKRDSNKRSSSP
ncbi:MAG: hypothetical protein M1503_12510 [Thaumarchaeota archaeon]|nr:hypothetical protein [Nitrososphaerota archaeon]MCL5319062.1 hypothetical protein [Nitrososphaerota archaeon]